MKNKAIFITLLSFILISCKEKGLNNSNILNKEKGSTTIIVDSITSNLNANKETNQLDSSLFSIPVQKKKYYLVQPKSNIKKGLDSLFQELNTKPQSFTLNTEESNFIEGKKGTLIYFPKDAFGDIKNVKVTLKESYSKSAYFFDCLSTQTAKGENLETAGMIEVKAYSMNNNKLNLVKGKSIKIHFPTKGKKKKGFRLFNEVLSKDGVIEWKYNLNGSLELKVLSVTLHAGNDLISFSARNAKLNFLNDNDRIIIHRRMDASFNNEFQLRVNTIVDSLLTYKIDGYEKDLEFHKTLRKVADNLKGPFIKHYPKLKKNSRVYFEFSNPDDTLFNLDYNKRFEIHFATKGNKNINDWELQRYILNSNKLGWINCDRFYNDQRQKVKLNITSLNKNETFMLYLKEANAAIRAVKGINMAVINNIPKGALGTLLGIKLMDGKVYVGKKNIKVSSKPIKQFKYEEIAIKNLDKEINKLSEF